MRKLFNTYFIVLAGVLSLISCTKKEKEDAKASRKEVINDVSIRNQDDTISYGLGIVWGNSSERAQMPGFSNAFYLGVQDNMNGNTPIIATSEMQEYMESNTEKVRSVTWTPADTLILPLEIKVESFFDTVSYIYGYQLVSSVIPMGLSKVTPSLLLGMHNYLNKDSLMMDYKEADVYLRRVLAAKKEVELMEKYGHLKMESEKWHAEKKKEEGVITTESGLQYKIIKKGNGNKPEPSNVMVVDYTLSRPDGLVVQKSGPEEPFKYFPQGVIKGWREATFQMQKGGEYEVYIPYYLGYGSGGMGENVPPYTTLVLRINVKDITTL